MKKPKRRPVKPNVNPDFKNVHHPEYIGLIEEAFTVRGVKYYNFKSDTDVRTGRYIFVQNFLQEVYFRMDIDRLKMYIRRVREEIDGSKQGSINVGNACAFLDQMKSLTDLAFEPDTVYRLASVIYFDDTEDVTKWDKGHNDAKIKAWKEEGTLDFFYRKPFTELMGLKDISETDLRGYLEKVQLMIDAYNTSLYETPPVTSKSSTTSV